MQGTAVVEKQQHKSHRDKHKAVVQPPPPLTRSSGRTTAAGSSGGSEGAAAAVMARSTRQQQTGSQGDTQDQPQPVHNTRRRAGSLVKSLPSRTRTKATPPPQGSQSAQSSPKQGAGESHNTRFAQSRRAGAAAATAASTSQSPAPLVLPDLPPAPVESVKPEPVPAAPSFSMPENAPPGYRPASMRPPLSRIPAFPLVDSYVPDTTSSDRRHPRQFIPDQLGFPTPEMEAKVRKEDREDKLLMATCAVLHAFENRALCPKEVAEVMLERNWLKNAGTTPFAHVSTCIRSHVSRASAAQPPYTPLLVPFELVGALTAEEVRAVGLHAEQRPAVKRGTLWYLNPQVFGPGVGADDPFVRCRREAGLAPSDKDGLYVRGLVPLQHNPAPLPPALALSSTLFNTPQDEADAMGGDEEGMGRGKRKRRASSAMMAAMGAPATPGPGPSPLGSGSSTPVAIPAAPRVPAGALAGPPGGGGGGHRRSQSFGGPSSAPVRSGIPKLKLRLTSLDEVDDSDGHTGEAAEWRRKNKKKVRRAGSEGLSRAGSVESNAIDDDDDDAYSTSSLPYRSSTFSSASSSALLAQSLLAASTPGSTARTPNLDTSLAPHTAVSPEILSLAHSSGTSFPFARPVTTPLHLSASAPNIFSHHFTHAPSPPDVVMDDAPSPSATDSRPTTSAGLATAVTPPSDSPTSEDDFHEAMLRGDDFDFEWGSESYTTAGTGASSVEASATIGAAVVSDASEEAQAELLAKAFEQQAAVMERRKEAQAGRERERAVTPAAGQEASVDTPATTPRSPGKELQEDAEEVKVGAGEKKVLEEEGIEVVKGPLGTISQIGMRVTLCGGLSGADDDDREDGDVVIVASRSHVKQEAPSSDPAQSTDTLINLAAHESPTHKSDSAHLIAPPPSPLPLDLSPMPALNNAFAAVDFDFVGHEEVERSQDGFGYIHDVDLADDEEEGEEDEIVTVKVEDDEPEMAVSSAPSSRASSAVPAFDTRLLASVRAGSAGSSSSDSDAFDPMTFVSPSTLATGLPVPQPAPSPPEMTDWSLSMDMLDDIDAEHAAPVDLMAPETIGLEELDLAWAGDDEEGSPPAPIPKPSPRIGGGLTLTVPRSSATAFLTGSSHPHSPHRFTSPIPSPRRTSSSRVPVLADFGKMGGRGAASPAPPALSRTSSSATIFAGSTQRGSSNLSSSPKSASSNVVMEPVIPLEPLVVATIIQRGIVVFSVEVTDLATARTMPLLRRLDTDYINATVLLQAALSSPLERASALAGLLVKTDTFRVPAASDAGVEGTWIPISVARDFLAAHAKQLGHLSSFLGDDLAAHFPEPVPTMRSSGKSSLEQKGAKDPNVAVLGSPSFEGAELLRRCGPPGVVRRVSSTSPATPPAAALFHDVQLNEDDEEEQSDEDEREVSSSPPPPRTRRSTAAARSTRRSSVVKPAPVTEQSPPRRSTRRQSAAAAAAGR